MADKDKITGLYFSKLIQLLFTGAASGVALDQFVKRVEIDRYPLSILGSLLAAPFILAHTIQSFSYQHGNYGSAFGAAAVWEFNAITSLFVNGLLYRTLYHPLKNFRGPFPPKLSKLWALSEVLKTEFQSDQHSGS
jgi:hypothetical protein